MGDPGDHYLLALAESASALIVTGDRHLLDLGDRYPIRRASELIEHLDG